MRWISRTAQRVGEAIGRMRGPARKRGSAVTGAPTVSAACRRPRATTAGAYLRRLHPHPQVLVRLSTDSYGAGGGGVVGCDAPGISQDRGGLT
jgi:hypothetical protein